jgi:hypothetical protein
MLARNPMMRRITPRTIIEELLLSRRWRLPSTSIEGRLPERGNP